MSEWSFNFWVSSEVVSDFVANSSYFLHRFPRLKKNNNHSKATIQLLKKCNVLIND